MISFDPSTLSSNVIQDSLPGDGLTISYIASEFSDSTAAAGQLYDSASSRSFMQDHFSNEARNQYDYMGVIYSNFC